MAAETNILDAWTREDQSDRVRFSKIACLWALLLIPAGATLDVVTYPDWFGWFFLVRLVNDLVIVGVLAAHFTPTGQRHIRLLTLAWLTTPQIAICYMIYLAGGFASSYYAGLNLAILAMGMVLPVTVSEVAILSGLTLSLYITAGLAHTGGGAEFRQLYDHIFFMLTTAVISTIAVYFNHRRRFSEFRLNFELNRRNRELSELDRLKSEFFANISHEFRTPLTLILAPLERLLEDHRNLPAEVVHRLELMRENSLRLLRLVNDLLDIIRLEEGKADLERRNLRLDTLLRGVVESVTPLAETRGITLTRSLADTPVVASVDRAAVEKIFFNILSNALKFTDKGGQVAVRSHLEPGLITVTVEDTGIGISKDNLSRVFDRFRQADSSATRKYGGTGLGLALVKELTESHGGTVTIASELGQGTSVRVSLPTLAANAANVDVETDEPESETALQRRLDLAAQQSAVATFSEPATDESSPLAEPGGTVLIVDDEPDIRRYLRDLLQNEYRVLTARDGREALDMTQRFRPALIVLDLMLPEIDGLEVCRRIKQNPELRASRIVLLTARAEESAKLAALGNGADDFLTKPFSSVEVRTRLRNLLHSAELEQDLHHRNHELEDTVAELRQTRNQLVHSEKLNALGRLSAGLLHEINNPLNYCLTALQFATNDPILETEAELKETLTDINDGMQRIRGIVKELRAFAYPSKGEQVEFRLSDAINTAVQMLAHEARDVDIDNRIGADWVVMGSPSHITQIMVNLLSNAFKAMRSPAIKRPGQVSLSATPEGEKIVISVRDNGPGISAEAIERIFDPFYTTADVGEGMGMGLSVCQTIVRNHNGELHVESKEGEWTEFSFSLMLKASDPGETALENASESST